MFPFLIPDPNFNPCCESETEFLPSYYVNKYLISGEIGDESIEEIGLSTIPGFGEAISFATFTETSVPEPTTLAIFGIGLAGLGVMRRRRKAA